MTPPLRVLEIGSYIAPAYAGMLLREQGATVVKWARSDDPTLDLDGGDELWEWLNEGKLTLHPHDGLAALQRVNLSVYDVIVDNVRESALDRLGVDPQQLAKANGLAWVSLRSDVGDTSFDIVAQARSWMEYVPWVPLYLGDTCAGLWMAFKALAMHQADAHEHAIIPQAASLQKLVEGELRVPFRKWDREPYGVERGGREVVVGYRGREVREPIRDHDWKVTHLRHVDGRITI